MRAARRRDDEGKKAPEKGVAMVVQRRAPRGKCKDRGQTIFGLAGWLERWCIGRRRRFAIWTSIAAWLGGTFAEVGLTRGRARRWATDFVARDEKQGVRPTSRNPAGQVGNHVVLSRGRGAETESMWSLTCADYRPTGAGLIWSIEFRAILVDFPSTVTP